MSRPRGKGVQRRLAEYAKELLTPWGFECEVDFSKRGGHQQLVVTHPLLHKQSIELPSSPKCEDHAYDFMRQRCQRIIRELTAGRPAASPR